MLAVPATAEECVPTTSEPEIAVGPYYVDNDPCAAVDPAAELWIEVGHYWIWPHGPVEVTCLYSIWWYQEANDIPGLQRGDEVVDDTCGGIIESDTLAFF